MFYAYNKLRSRKWLESKIKEKAKHMRWDVRCVCCTYCTTSVDSNELVKLNTESKCGRWKRDMHREWEMMIGISCLTLEFYSIIFHFVNQSWIAFNFALKPWMKPSPNEKYQTQIESLKMFLFAIWNGTTRQRWMLSKIIHINNEEKRKYSRAIYYPKWTNTVNTWTM